MTEVRRIKAEDYLYALKEDVVFLSGYFAATLIGLGYDREKMIDELARLNPASFVIPEVIDLVKLTGPWTVIDGGKE